MKTTIDQSDFIAAFRAFDRYDQFGYKALCILFDYLEDLEGDTGEDLELDVIALCCDYSVDSWEDIAQERGIDLTDCEDDVERMAAVVDYLNEHTRVCGTFDSNIVYCSAF